MTAQNLIKGIRLVVCFLLAGCLGKQKKETLPFYNTPDFTPQWITPADKEYSSIHTIAPFQFFNQQGKTISNKDVKGKIYVANFFFTRCGSICPKMNNNLKKIAERFADNPDVLILSHSVTPESDSIAQLANYGARISIDARKWWLLTGDKNEIYNLARRSYFADEEMGYNFTSKDFLHTENAVLIDRKGRIRGVYNATLELEIDKLADHINTLLDEE